LITRGIEWILVVYKREKFSKQWKNEEEKSIGNEEPI